MSDTGDDYEESFESFSSKSPTKSPKKADGSDQSQQSEGDDIKGMDLEQFMGNYQIQIGGKEGETPGEDPSLRPLDGLSPDKGSVHRAMQKKFGGLGDSSDTGHSGRVTSPVDTGRNSYGNKENAANEEEEEEEDHDVDGGDSHYQDEADVLLAKIKNGTLGTGISMPASIEKKLAEKKASLTREYEKERLQLKERMQNLEANERSEVLEASKKYLENAKAKASAERGPIDADRLSYYHSLLAGDGNDGGGRGGKPVKKKPAAATGGGGKGKHALESEAEHESRVDDLLAELLPGRYGKAGGAAAKKSTKTTQKSDSLRTRRGNYDSEEREGNNDNNNDRRSEWSGKREYGLTQPDYNGSVNKAGTSSSKGGGGKGKYSGEMGMGVAQDGMGRDEPSFSAQIVHLKKELKGRDDRLQRLTEHSMQLGQMCEKQKMEIADYKKQLNTFEMELDAKEQRASDAMRLRKKAQKKAKQMEEQVKEYQGAVSEIERLTDREQALLEAVDALSGQNEDLIRKLKQSMARELELSQNAVVDESDHLHNVHDSIGGGGGKKRHQNRNRERDYSPSSPPRAQSDTRAMRNSRKKAYSGGGGSGRLPKV